MKKIVLSLAAITVALSTQAYAEPTMFGRLFIVSDYADGKFKADRQQIDRLNANHNQSFNTKHSTDYTEINTYKSTMGWRGSEAITDNTDIIYQLQFAVSLDGNENVSLANRSHFLGLSNKDWGTIRLGRYWTPIDLINNVVVAKGYWDNNGTTALSATDPDVRALNMTDAIPRISNMALWTSPKKDNLPFEVALMYSTDEPSDKPADGKSYGGYITYDQDTGFIASVAYDKDIDIAGDVVRATATYDLERLSADIPVTIGALYQQADYDNISTKEKGYVLSARWRLDNFSRPVALYAQYNNTSDLGGVNGADSQQYVVGGEYHFRKNVIAHAYAGYNKAEDVRGVVGSVTDAQGNNSVVYANGDSDIFALGAGLEYIF